MLKTYLQGCISPLKRLLIHIWIAMPAHLWPSTSKKVVSKGLINARNLIWWALNLLFSSTWAKWFRTRREKLERFSKITSSKPSSHTSKELSQALCRRIVAKHSQKWLWALQSRWEPILAAIAASIRVITVRQHRMILVRLLLHYTIDKLLRQLELLIQS